MFTTGVTVITLATGLIDGGLVTAAVRSAATRPEQMRQVFLALLTSRVGVALVASLILGPLLLLLLPPAPGVTAFAVYLLLQLVLTAAFGAYAVYAQATLRVIRWVTADLAGKALSALLLIGLSLSGSSSLGLAGLALAAGSGLSLAVAVGLHPKDRPHPRQDLLAGFRLLRASVALSIAFVLNTLYFRLDTVLLAALTDARTVGLYGLSYRLLDALLLAGGFYYASIIPAAVRAGRTQEGTKRTIVAGWSLVFAVGLLTVTTGEILAPDLIRLIGGASYDEAIPVLRLLIPAIVASWLNGVSGAAVIAEGKERQALRVNVVVLVVNVVGNLVLIPLIGMFGAAAMTLVSELAAFLLLLPLLPRLLGYGFRVRRPVTLLLGALTPSLVLLTATLLHIPHYVAILLTACSALAYLLLVVLVLGAKRRPQSRSRVATPHFAPDNGKQR